MTARLSFSPRISAALFAVAVAAFATSPALAQNEREDLETTGRVMGMQGNLLQVEARDGVVWAVQLPNQMRNVTYRNTAGVKFLGPGMFVNFTGKFDKRGKMEGAVSMLKVFTPESPDQLGVFPDALGGGGIGLGTAPGQAQPAVADDGPKSYQVSGRVMKVARNGDMTIQAGQQSVTAPVDPAVQIEIEVGTLELAKLGDTIDLEAWYYPQRVGQAMARRVEVTGAQPLGVEPVPGAPAPNDSGKPAFTPGFVPKPGTPPGTAPQPGTPQPNPLQPGTPKPGTAPQPGIPKPGASPFDLK
jgi:hypothetical protein